MSQSPVKSSQHNVDSFLAELDNTALTKNSNGRGRLIFAMDATASRQPTWDLAMHHQQQMFAESKAFGSLDVQLVYFRGYQECKASRWVDNPIDLHAIMQKIQCVAGKTQIGRVLAHAAEQTSKKPVQAVVYVGDCMEEDIDHLGNLAGKLKILNLPVFIFQEGHDPVATAAFTQLAKISGGAHCQFDAASGAQLSQLLNAVAVYASGGRSALKTLSNRSGSANALLQQLD